MNTKYNYHRLPTLIVACALCAPSYAGPGTPPHVGIQLSAGPVFSRLSPETNVGIEDHFGSGFYVSSRSDVGDTPYIFDFSYSDLGDTLLKDGSRVDYQSIDIGFGRRFKLNESTQLTARTFVGHLDAGSAEPNTTVKVRHDVHVGVALGIEHAFNEHIGVTAEVINYDEDANATVFSIYQRY